MITNIHIKGFWNRYEINWRPYSDVNILVGINGSGKSTLLRVLDSALSHPNTANSFLSNDCGIACGITIEREGQDKHHLISTFDDIIREKQALDGELSPLTALLYETIFDTRIPSLNSYRLKATENPAAASRINERLQQWIGIVNDFFATTGKAIEIQGSDVLFKQSGGGIITLGQLSSGEKQLLVILANALIQDREPFILLMDEPEISLDIDWQYKLIDTIRKLNPNCQLVVATHSPGIFGDSWNGRLVFMEDLLEG